MMMMTMMVVNIWTFFGWMLKYLTSLISSFLMTVIKKHRLEKYVSQILL